MMKAHALQNYFLQPAQTKRTRRLSGVVSFLIGVSMQSISSGF
jgi:hypothetical protein